MHLEETKMEINWATILTSAASIIAFIWTYLGVGKYLMQKAHNTKTQADDLALDVAQGIVAEIYDAHVRDFKKNGKKVSSDKALNFKNMAKSQIVKSINKYGIKFPEEAVSWLIEKAIAKNKEETKEAKT